mgnify:FL=1
MVLTTIFLVNASMVGGGWAVVILLQRKKVNNTLSTAGKIDYLILLSFVKVRPGLVFI